MQQLGRIASREENAHASVRLRHTPVVIVRECGRSSISEKSVIEPRGGGVLDPRMRGDDDCG